MECSIRIAGHTARLTGEFESTPLYFRSYLTEEAPETTLTATRDDREKEQAALLAEALEEGLRPRTFPEPFLERAVFQKKMAEFLFPHDILMVHGSTVAMDGGAYLFTAKCGTGKSTHTRLWRQVFGERAKMVNDDKPFLLLKEDSVLACGSPWSGKHGLDSNITVPLQGICLLERGKENRIQPAAPEELLPMLLHESFCPEGQEARFRELVERLAERTSLWKMACNMDPDAARMAYDAMHRD